MNGNDAPAPRALASLLQVLKTLNSGVASWAASLSWWRLLLLFLLVLLWLMLSS